jgi:hypothetical protein
MESVNQFSLPHSHRTYQCSQCGHQQRIGTNHTSSCSDYCKNCSWKPSQGEGHKIPALGSHTYRQFEYVGHLTSEEQQKLATNRPYFQPTIHADSGERMDYEPDEIEMEEEALSLGDWLEQWAAAVEDGQSHISKDEAIRRWRRRYGT